MTASVLNFFAPFLKNNKKKNQVVSTDALKYPKPALTEALGDGAFLSSTAHVVQNKRTNSVFGVRKPS